MISPRCSGRRMLYAFEVVARHLKVMLDPSISARVNLGAVSRHSAGQSKM